MCKRNPGAQFYRPMKGDRGFGVLVPELAQNPDTAVPIVSVTAAVLLAFFLAVGVPRGLMCFLGDHWGAAAVQTRPPSIILEALTEAFCHSETPGYCLQLHMLVSHRMVIPGKSIFLNPLEVL